MRLSPRLYAKQLVVACLAEPQRVNELVNKFWQRIWLDKKFSWRKSIVQEVGSVWHELTRRAEVKVSARRQLHPVEQKFIGNEITKKFGQDVDIRWEVKPHILGGLVVTVNNERFDFSLKGNLDSLYYNLVK